MTTLSLSVLPKAISKSFSIDDIPSYDPIIVGPNRYTTLDVKTWISVPPIKRNRNSHNRVQKMKKIFDEKSFDDTQPLTEVVMAEIMNDFIDYVQPADGTPAIKHEYHKGELYRLDGNTRAYYWELHPDMQPNLLTVRIIPLTKKEDVKVYYSFDNAKAAENSKEILQGLIRLYNWQPKQRMFINGEFKTALDAAYYDPDTQPSEVTFNYYYNECKMLDKIGSPNGPWISEPALKGVKSQALIAAFLIALKTYGTNNTDLLKLIQEIISIDHDTLVKSGMNTGEFTAAEVIAAEWGGYQYRKQKAKDGWARFEHVFDKDGKPCVGQTSRASMVPQLDFALYYIDRYMQNPGLTWTVNGGIKDKWAGTYDEFVEGLPK
jgi:hypothetical protein